MPTPTGRAASALPTRASRSSRPTCSASTCISPGEPRVAAIATKHVIFVAAENAALPKGKIGGVGDIVRDLPVALVRLGWQVTVLTPSYGMFAKLPGAARLGRLDVRFAGARHSVEVSEVPAANAPVRNVVFEHPLLSPAGPGRIYAHVEGEGPYATDAGKFAFFGAIAAAWVLDQDTVPDVVHLHDWHAAFYCLLRCFSSQHERLQEITTAFTIHNLSYQGTRPLRGSPSSLEEWFPGLTYDAAVVGDPDAGGCINPMALAIRTVERVSTVSPTYAREILLPSDPARGFVGGEGLERQLASAARAGRLVGILNGCEYEDKRGRRPGWERIVGLARHQVDAWLAQAPGDPDHLLARERLQSLPKRRPAHILTSIGRLVRQKVSLFLEPLDDGRTALEHIADGLGSKGVLILVGSGEAAYERRVSEVARDCRRLIFLRGYSETLADPLYRAGDLFLMPSSFEPCGISQMLAMRAGQPCVVHGVGGLRDTVEDGRSGFVFEGATPHEQAENFVAAVARALELKDQHPDRWQKLRIRAASMRFDWASAARQTVSRLYQAGD